MASGPLDLPDELVWRILQLAFGSDVRAAWCAGRLVCRRFSALVESLPWASLGIETGSASFPLGLAELVRQGRVRLSAAASVTFSFPSELVEALVGAAGGGGAAAGDAAEGAFPGLREAAAAVARSQRVREALADAAAALLGASAASPTGSLRSVGIKLPLMRPAEARAAALAVVRALRAAGASLESLHLHVVGFRFGADAADVGEAFSPLAALRQLRLEGGWRLDGPSAAALAAAAPALAELEAPLEDAAALAALAPLPSPPFGSLSGLEVLDTCFLVGGAARGRTWRRWAPSLASRSSFCGAAGRRGRAARRGPPGGPRGALRRLPRLARLELELAAPDPPAAAALADALSAAPPALRRAALLLSDPPPPALAAALVACPRLAAAKLRFCGPPLRPDGHGTFEFLPLAPLGPRLGGELVLHFDEDPPAPALAALKQMFPAAEIR
eukprot:tig00000269_g23771.t1